MSAQPLSPAQLAYRDRLDAIEAEKLKALGTPGANAERILITATKRMAQAYSAFRTALAQLEARS